MVKKIALAELYTGALSLRQKQGLLAAYLDYIKFMRNMEHIVMRYKISGLATYQIHDMFGDQLDQRPWEIKEITPVAHQDYTNFIVNVSKESITNPHNCFISFKMTNRIEEKKSIISAPSTYNIYSDTPTLPSKIEHFTIAYPKEERLADANFIINDRWILNYIYKDKDQLISEALSNKKIEDRFKSILNLLAELSEENVTLTEEEVRVAQTQAMASTMLAPYENILLCTLTSLAEEENNILKSLLYRRYAENYFFQAENMELLSSAATFQDYLNLRHLMHHRLKMHGKIGNFNTNYKERNESIRQRYMASYCRLCDKSLTERLSSYEKAATVFRPLVTMLNPQLLIRTPDESNSKFIIRIKKYMSANPETPVLVETNYPYNHPKKEALLKNIAKVAPHAQIIDKKESDIEEFAEMAGNYMMRQKYLEIFEQIEYKVCMFSLFHGQNKSAPAAWQYLRKKNILSPEEMETWVKYKLLRNTISHTYFDEELIKRLKEEIRTFAAAATDLENKIVNDDIKITMVEGNIYKIEHKSGKVVTINYEDKTLISVTTANGRQLNSSATDNKTSKSIYTEEYPNGISITLSGTKIISCFFRNGLHFDFKYNKITYPDRSKLYLGNDDKNYIILKGGSKLITDKTFKILNYIVKNKSVNIVKNDMMYLSDKHKITTDNTTTLANIEISAENDAPVIKATYVGKADGTAEILFADGTVFKTNAGQGSILSHNGVELTYQTRQQFAESYTLLSPLMRKKQQTR